MGLDVSETAILPEDEQENEVDQDGEMAEIRRVIGVYEECRGGLLESKSEGEISYEDLLLQQTREKDPKKLAEIKSSIDLHLYCFNEIDIYVKEFDRRLQICYKLIDPNLRPSRTTMTGPSFRAPVIAQQAQNPIRRRPTMALTFNQSAHILDGDSSQELAQSPD